MDLPRFTSGKLGNLEFSHMNEAFELLDRLRPLLDGDATTAMSRQGFLFAKITGSNATTGAMEWTEVQMKAATASSARIEWETMAGGRSSDVSTSASFTPAFLPPTVGGAVVAPLPVNSVALLRSSQRVDGKTAWLVVSSVATAGSEVFAARITGSIAHKTDAQGVPYVWKYAWEQVDLRQEWNYEWHTFNGGKFGSFSQPYGWGVAFNGAERAGISGVGGNPPTGATERPAAIEAGVVVSMQLLPPLNALHFFSMPNGVTIACGGTP